ncbi:MAG: nucleoside phosphorylase [Clostridiales bacterium]|nr:nucleoside phosphorylase [Clostridiales bacterium]MCI7573801.1 nucleoside phosphorylase [Clostridiales bacterium]
MEQLIARGTKKILFYGNCGVLNMEIAAGHLILPTAAYRDEDTSYHYLPVGDYVDVSTCEELSGIMDELHLPYVTGKVWTTDAFYRETRNNMEKRKADGCIAVDMECASVMTVGQFRGIPVYQFFYADDSLDGEKWNPRTLGARPASSHEKYLRVALEIASKL